ncbi:hypothetical protein O181_037447 [Austropuccinia psidii MF-1]|uniref:Uncharacterized protein n=1 Tax=Austropuccinia psidii MF-1 TaxID=1389203 RepID=A0A9Q3DCQ1_9BASI|nr:hypothetical protein [Austropuccinia psidii MF-1]
MMTIDVMHTVFVGMLRDLSITYLEIPEEAKFIDQKRKTLNKEGNTQNISFEGRNQKSNKRRERDELSESSGSQLKLVTIPETTLLINLEPPTPLNKVSNWKAQQSIVPPSPPTSVREENPTRSKSKNLYAPWKDKALKVQKTELM